MFVDPTGNACHANDLGQSGPLCPIGPDGKCLYHHTEDCCYPAQELIWQNSQASLKNTFSINDFKNNDGSYSLYDNHRHNPDALFHEKILSFSGDISKDFSDGMLGVGGSVTLMTGAWEWKYVDLGLLNFGQASAYIGRTKNYTGVGAMVTAWAPEVSFKYGGAVITIGADIGSIGVQAGYADGMFKFGGAYGVGAHVGISWDG